MRTVVGSYRLAPPQLATTVVAGTAFAYLVSKALSLELRFVFAFITGMVMLSLAMIFAPRARDVLIAMLAFNLPFTSIEKTFFLTTETTFVTPGVGIGLTDLILLSLYAHWLWRTLVARDEPLPRLRSLDLWVIGFIVVSGLSIINASSRSLTFLEVVRLMKYGLAYFYLAHNVKKSDLRWLVAGLMFSLLLQTSIGLVQQRTGKLLGIGRTKGASELNYEQYKVTNFEAYYRAEGTTFDSHAFALYLAMSLPIPLALALAPQVNKRYRLIAGAVTILGLPGLISSFARAGWTAFAAAVLVLVLCLAYWRQWRTMFLTGAVITLIAVPALLPFAKAIKTRLFDAPPELVSARVETVEMALDIWRDSLWTGIGANGYMRDLEKKLSIFEGDPYFIPPHNMIVLVVTETGVIGLVYFIGFSLAIIRLGWQTIRLEGNSPIGVLAAALLAAFIAFQVEGIFDPIYATNVTYFLLWFQLGIAGALNAHAKARPPRAQLPVAEAF